MGWSLGTLTLVLRVLTALEALALSVAAICMIDRQWRLAAIATASLVAVYVLVDRRIERRVAEAEISLGS